VRCLCNGQIRRHSDVVVCRGCDSGKFTNTVAQSVCLPCWENSGHDNTYTGCLCNSGYTPGDKDSCGPCGSNTFKDEQSNTLCSSCRDNSESTPGAVNANDCKCVAGRFLDGAVCEPCATSSFKEGVGNAMCTQCATSFSTRDPQQQRPCACDPPDISRRWPVRPAPQITSSPCSLTRPIPRAAGTARCLEALWLTRKPSASVTRGSTN